MKGWVLIPREAMVTPIFHLDASNDSSMSDSGDEHVDRSHLTSLLVILRKPELLGENREVIVQMRSVSNERKLIQLSL